jgi:membrane protein YdbS with pleckstrin-like domain
MVGHNKEEAENTMNSFIITLGLILTILIGSIVGLFISQKTRKFAVVGFIIIVIIIIVILIRRLFFPFPVL